MTRKARSEGNQWQERGSFFLFAVAIAAFLALIAIGAWHGDFGEVLLNGSTL